MASSMQEYLNSNDTPEIVPHALMHGLNIPG